ncbi:MAG: FadR family transcriptional regulator [Moraxellaceae bacterium]|jgi:DNA-binding FadR family transcriptional regulator|nr:MAG: FadR family transcriptional regulator [Moraxellaceae bacterium]
MSLVDGGLNLTQLVANALGQAIVQGKYDESSCLPTEAEISTQFGTSRSVTREAVKMLTAKGLIASRPRQGIRVQPLQYWNLFDTEVLHWVQEARPSDALRREFAEMCWAIAPEAVSLACRSTDGKVLDNVSQALHAVEESQGNPQLWAQAHEGFMRAFLLASGNRFFSQFEDFLRVSLRLHSGRINRLPHSTEPHRAVCQALIEGRAAAAAAAMRRLMAECFGWSFNAETACT